MKFLLKWILNGVIVVLLLMYYTEINLLNACITATALTLVAYFVGDQLILRSTNNTIATICDFVLAYAVLWVAADSMRLDLAASEILVISFVIAVAEWVLHRFVFQPRMAATAG